MLIHHVKHRNDKISQLAIVMGYVQHFDREVIENLRRWFLNLHESALRNQCWERAVMAQAAAQVLAELLKRNRPGQTSSARCDYCFFDQPVKPVLNEKVLESMLRRELHELVPLTADSPSCRSEASPRQAVKVSSSALCDSLAHQN